MGGAADNLQFLFAGEQFVGFLIEGNDRFVELTPVVLTRALEPFPLPVRTLDALHLASIEFLRAQRQSVTLASYDERMVRVARELGVVIFE